MPTETLWGAGTATFTGSWVDPEHSAGASDSSFARTSSEGAVLNRPMADTVAMGAAAACSQVEFGFNGFISGSSGTTGDMLVELVGAGGVLDSYTYSTITNSSPGPAGSKVFVPSVPLTKSEVDALFIRFTALNDNRVSQWAVESAFFIVTYGEGGDPPAPADNSSFLMFF